MHLFSIFNRVCFCWCEYRTTVTSEYWRGHRRKRIFKLGKLTVWVRGKNWIDKNKEEL